MTDEFAPGSVAFLDEPASSGCGSWFDLLRSSRLSEVEAEPAAAADEDAEAEADEPAAADGIRLVTVTLCLNTAPW